MEVELADDDDDDEVLLVRALLLALGRISLKRPPRKERSLFHSAGLQGVTEWVNHSFLSFGTRKYRAAPS